MDLQSEFAIVKEGDTSLTLPPITLYSKTEDTSALVMDEARIFFEYGTMQFKSSMCIRSATQVIKSLW